MQRSRLFGLGLFILLVFFLSGCGAYTTGNIKLQQKNYEQAITYYLEELSENPDHFRARERLGFAYFKTGQLDKAIEELERALEQKPGDPSATYYLGLAWLNKGETGKAIDVWRTYRNAEEPLVEQQIQRQLTLLEIAESIRLARQALAEEKKLQTLRPEPGTTAVFYFKDVSSDARYRYMQKALAMMITTDLSQIQSLQVVERMRVQFLLAEMGLGETGLVDMQTAPRAGRLLGAESLIVGTLEPGSLAVNASVASTSEQDVVGAFSVKAEEQEFYELQKEIVYNIVRVLGISLTPQEKQVIAKYHTKNLKAVIYFGQGLEALDQGKWEEAKEFFKKALKEDPNFLLAADALASTPESSAPSIGTLGAATTAELAAISEQSMGKAAAEQAAETGTKSSDTGGTGEGEGSNVGSVGVSW